MKKTFLIVIAMFCSAVIISSVIFSGAEADNSVSEPVDKTEVTSATEAALLDMLNKNYVYGLDFENADNVVNCSMNVFKGAVDEEGYVSQKSVVDFVYNMYGIEIIDLSALNSEYPYKEGFVYSLPFSTQYSHSNISVRVNEDDTITACTDVAVTSLDGDTDSYVATTLFVKNDKSSFGYNIISSEIAVDCSAA